MEAQYQNEVRLAIQNLYIAYVDVLVARETVRYLEASIKGLDEVLRAYQGLSSRKTPQARMSIRPGRIVRLRSSAFSTPGKPSGSGRSSLGKCWACRPTRPSDSSYGGRSATSPLRLVPSRTASNRHPSRPDLAAFRLGIASAEANVGLQRANRFADAYVLYQPYTYQNNAPYGKQSGTSWALGITVPLPLYNRNQGNIERAKINVYQSEVQFAYQQKRVEIEVRQAIKEYQVSREIADRIRLQVLPGLKQAYSDRLRLFRKARSPRSSSSTRSADTTRWPKPISTRRCVIVAAC